MKVGAGDFHRTLTNAAIFASRDDKLPSIHGVALSGDGSRLTAMATTRFHLGAASCAYEGEPFDPVLIPLSSVNLIGRVVKPTRNSIRRTSEVVSLRVTPKGKRVWVSVGERSLMVRTVEAVPVQWKQLLPTGEEPNSFSGAAIFGMNPGYLADFAKVDTGCHASASWYMHSPSRPMCVRIGDDFVGLVMPTRLGGGTTWGKPEWVK